MLLTVSHRTPSLLFHRFWFRFFVCVFQVQVIVKWELRDDQGNDLFCFSIPAVIVDWLYSNLFVKKMASNTYPLLQILKFVIILIPNFGRSSQIETLLNPNEYFATPNFHEWGQVKMDWKCRSCHPCSTTADMSFCRRKFPEGCMCEFHQTILQNNLRSEFGSEEKTHTFWRSVREQV